MRVAAPRPLVVATASLSLACGLISGLDALERSAAAPDDAAPAVDSAPANDALLDGGLDAFPGDAGGDGGRDAATDSADACAPGMVAVSEFCIDATEVTKAAYGAFLASHAASTITQPAVCAWNTDFTPIVWPFSAAAANDPVTFIDWCDAFAFCAASGKHLCGKRGGGPNDPALLTSAAHSQWFAACSRLGDGLHAYPYGNAFVADVCNGGTSTDGAAPLVGVGTLTGCVGGFAGIDDMSGNAREWEDSCTASPDPALSNCNVRGGGADEPADALRCDATLTRARNSPSAHTGFRCCAN